MTRLNNEFRLSGRCGSDVEVVHPQGRDPIGKVSIAVEAGYYDRDDKYVERTIWQDLIFYRGHHIERLEKHAGKGVEIHVMGTLGKDVWESATRTNTDGTAAKDSRVTLNVTALSIGRRPKGADDGAQSGASSGYEDSDQDIPF